MVKTILTSLLLIFLFGCGLNKHKPQDIVYRDVKVPVYVFPKIEKPARPELEIETLSSEEKEQLGVLVQAYVITIKQLEQYSKKLEEIIDNFNQKSNLDQINQL